eukprot:TRINITY_DN3607_c0_g1_i1.p1 TRINITY_DN3607_c0_g1~~TRINITY_DN3607_c0_g1_i1.p1  ORF type:complete len:337 (+),score=43.74 TRINITY_DN3607_c0_g1_i1:51-1061(+)
MVASGPGPLNLLLGLLSLFFILWGMFPTHPPIHPNIARGLAENIGRPSDSNLDAKLNKYVHVTMPYDLGEYNVGMKALINSILKNTLDPHKLFFHFLVEPSSAQKAFFFMSDLEHLQGAPVEASVWTGWEQKKHLYPGGSRFGNSLNVGRIYLVDLFPRVRKIISLDTDQVVLGDLADLWRGADLAQYAIGSTRGEKAKKLRYYVRLENPAIANSTLDLDETVFGGGLFVANLTSWRERNLIGKIEEWCAIHARDPVMADRTLKKTLLNLVFNKNFFQLEDHWNSGNCMSEAATLQKTKILHFAGFDGKPWDLLSNCPAQTRELWEEYFGYIEYTY